MKVLFVCRANVGRSQIAEALFNKLAEGKHLAQSAGVEALGSDGTDLDGMPLKGRASSKYVIECMQEIGIDISGRSIKRLTPGMVAEADKVIAMVKPDTLPDFLKSSDKVEHWDISDPDEQPLAYYRTTRDEIRKKIEGLLPKLARST